MRDIGCGTIGLVVVAGIVVFLTVQSLLAPFHYHGNETPALATLRNLASTQAQFRDSKACDVDGDGIGEFGTFGEMTAAIGPRGDPLGRVRGAPLAPPVLTAALSNGDRDGVVMKSGYLFRIFLPAKGGGAAHEGSAGFRDPFDRPVDTDAAEKVWCAYAWPVAYGRSGKWAFFVNQSGDVWRMDNEGGRYSGVVAGPAWDAAMAADGKGNWSPAPRAGGSIGRDGNVWKVTN